MNKKFIQVSIAVIFLLTACGQGTARETPEATNTPVAPIETPTLLQPPTNTRTSIPTETPTASITPLPTIPTFTPTFDVSTIVTVTPAQKEVCPQESSSLSIDRQELSTLGSDHQQFRDYILDFLNRGGSIQSIRAIYDYPNEFIQKVDVTNDGVDEIMIAYGIWIDIFSCIDGNYHLSDTSTTEGAMDSRILNVTDLNSDGQAEVIVYFDGCLGGRCPSIEILEWDGTQFKDLIPVYSRCQGLTAPLSVHIQDLDHNGTKEVILSNDGVPWPDGLGYPYRQDILVCMWNGQSFDLFKGGYGPPFYRYQALQDGDTAARNGDYTNALTFYQETIFSNKLEWFTKERGINDFWLYWSSYFPSSEEPTITPSPSLNPDPREYPSLAAYAYYRIMLIHILQGYDSDAGAVYKTLQQKFGNDPYGKPYVEMATLFWDTYQSTHKMYDSCAAAIQYAAEHPGILKPLGSNYHGLQSHTYVPADVCPFR